jgi:hypothetical protein
MGFIRERTLYLLGGLHLLAVDILSSSPALRYLNYVHVAILRVIALLPQNEQGARLIPKT